MCVCVWRLVEGIGHDVRNVTARREEGIFRRVIIGIKLSISFMSVFFSNNEIRRIKYYRACWILSYYGCLCNLFFCICWWCMDIVMCVFMCACRCVYKCVSMYGERGGRQWVFSLTVLYLTVQTNNKNNKTKTWVFLSLNLITRLAGLLHLPAKHWADRFVPPCLGF